MMPGREKITKKIAAMSMRIINICFCVFALPVICSAAPVEVADVASPSFSRLLLGLLFVVAMIVCAAWLIRRTPIGAGSQKLRVVASAPLGTRERVVLLQVGPQQILIGVTATQISHLHTLPESLDVSTDAVHPFAQTLSALLKGKSGA